MKTIIEVRGGTVQTVYYAEGTHDDVVVLDYDNVESEEQYKELDAFLKTQKNLTPIDFREI